MRSQSPVSSVISYGVVRDSFVQILLCMSGTENGRFECIRNFTLLKRNAESGEGVVSPRVVLCLPCEFNPLCFPQIVFRINVSTSCSFPFCPYHYDPR